MAIPERSQHSLDGRTILMVEDNEDDVFLRQRAFSKANVTNPLQAVADGEEALNYLQGKGQYADRGKFPFPVVVFLDLNMPKKSGFEVLEYIRQHPTLRKLTVNILSSSTRPSDINKAAFLGTNAYFIKPTQIDKFQELIKGWYDLAWFYAFPKIE
jgi:CheY-like chemotaxis protein